MWIGEKFQSNPEIAGSPRNSFTGASKLTKDYQTPNAAKEVPGSQAVRDKSDSRKGNSPDLQLRSQRVC